MSTAKYTATLPIPPLASLAHATTQEYSLYVGFARTCVRSEGWDALSRQYMAMKEECAKRGLRACAFPQFREVLRRMRKKILPGPFTTPSGAFDALLISRGPKANYRDLAAGWRWTSKYFD